MGSIRQRIDDFCQRFKLRVPLLLAPMAGASAPALSIAVAEAGGLGACGVVLMSAAQILEWSRTVRGSGRAFQLNNWVPDPVPERDPEHEAALRSFLAGFGPAVPAEAADSRPPDFAAQCAAMIEAGAPILSSVMGLFPADFVAQMRARGVAWFANISTLAEARMAAAAGADVLVAQGAEAGGHRGCFAAGDAERAQVGLIALLPAVVDAVNIPVVATGGIGDARGVAAAFMLGASAVQIGTGFLRCPEAQLDPAWAEALARTAPEGTIVSRAFSGRAGRSLLTDYTRAATAPGAPRPAPYPVQRGLTAPMRKAALQAHDVQRMQAWAGQAAALARAQPAGELVQQLWSDTQRLLDSAGH